jgi:hypothetical protein
MRFCLVAAKPCGRCGVAGAAGPGHCVGPGQDAALAGPDGPGGGSGRGRFPQTPPSLAVFPGL